MNTDFDWYVGIDWASEAHEVCVLTSDGTVVERRSVPHSGDGLRDLARRLASLGSGVLERVAVSIEVPHGAVVETLLERGFAVFSLNPKQLDRFRDRFSPAGAKDDRRDARVLADALRTDRHCFRRLEIEPAELIRLRELVRTADDLKDELRRGSNQLRELLHRYYGQALVLSPAADEPWIWELLVKAPTPAKGRGLRETSLAQLLRRHRIRRISPQAVWETLHATPLSVVPGTTEAASEHVGLLVSRLQLLHRQFREVQNRIDAVLNSLGQADPAADDTDPHTREHRDVEILLSLPGYGRLTVATMLAGAHRAIQDRDYHALRAQSGLAPVTKASGKSRRVVMRRACDKRLRNAFYHVARVASIHDEAARAYYHSQRQRGHSHGRALRALADRLLRLQFAMLKTGTLYDPARLTRPAVAPAIAA